jgi:hypothetical protein
LEEAVQLSVIHRVSLVTVVDIAYEYLYLKLSPMNFNYKVCQEAVQHL